jgi:hypothetical protein
LNVPEPHRTMATAKAGSDRLQMPPIEAFCDAESYYATLAHETTHSRPTDSACAMAFVLIKVESLPLRMDFENTENILIT